MVGLLTHAIQTTALKALVEIFDVQNSFFETILTL